MSGEPEIEPPTWPTLPPPFTAKKYVGKYRLSNPPDRDEENLRHITSNALSASRARGSTLPPARNPVPIYP